LKGIATLGVSGDLGIAAGALELIIGAVMLVYSIWKEGVNCSQGGSKTGGGTKGRK
jgi:hypothetical protein